MAPGVLLFVAVFGTVWYATFFALWEYVYGDSHGGRWAAFAWPIALAVAIAAVAAFVQGWNYRRLRLKSLLLWLVLLVTAAAAWLVFADRYLL